MNEPTTSNQPQVQPRAKPVGGFHAIPARAIVAAWWAYKRELLEYRDVRVWLACAELVSRRCAMRKHRTPCYTHAELGALVGGVGGEHLRASLRRLESTGLLIWSETGVKVLNGDKLAERDADGGLAARLDLLVNQRRTVPVPRRLLVFMARCPRPVVVATLLGHLLRCLYTRNRQCRPDGLCKAAWVAEVFEIDERNVKGARAELIRADILRPRRAPQWVLNRYGLPVAINLEWSPRPQAIPPAEPPPPPQLSTTVSPPPMNTGISLSRSKDQQPVQPTKPAAAPTAAGVRTRTRERLPTLGRVERSDLTDPRRLHALWRGLAQRDPALATEHGRLQIFTAAARALRLGTRSPGAFFAALVRRGLWNHLSGLDEDAARRLLADAPCPTVTHGSDVAASRIRVCGAPADSAPAVEETGPSLTRAEIRVLIATSLAGTAGVGEPLRRCALEEPGPSGNGRRGRAHGLCPSPGCPWCVGGVHKNEKG